MRRAATLAVLLAGCTAAPGPRAPGRPVRIVSLDYCADQYALKLAGRERIAALSPQAEAPFSYMRRAARGVPTVQPRAEEVLALRPDLVIRSYGGGPGAAAFFARAGVPVLQLGYAEDIAGVRAGLLEVARGLGEAERGRALAEGMDRRLAALRRRGGVREVMYMTSGGVTTGPGSLVDELIRAAGHRNFQREPGWRPIPLERLTYERPGLVAAAFYGRDALLDRWSAARHPLATAQLRDRPVAALESAWTACGGWFLLDAVEAMAKR